MGSVRASLTRGRAVATGYSNPFVCLSICLFVISEPGCHGAAFYSMDIAVTQQVTVADVELRCQIKASKKLELARWLHRLASCTRPFEALIMICGLLSWKASLQM